MPAATSKINANRVTSAPASGGLHSITPVNTAAASTAASTAAPAAGTAVRAVVKAASVASRSVLAADTAAPATNTQPVTAGTADCSEHLPANSTEFLSGLLGP